MQQTEPTGGPDGAIALPPDSIVTSPILRWLLFVFATLMVGLGFIGIFVPGLPTTVFLIAALWGYTRSSSRFQHWLWYHPKLGPPIRDWHTDRVIPVRAKVFAVFMMSLSVVYVYVAVPVDWAWWTMALVMIPVATYILTRNSQRRADEREGTPQ